MDWVDGLRLLFLVGMAYGTYTAFRNRPKPLRYAGRVYYPLPDGRFCTRWGRIIRDPALEQALRQALGNPSQG